MVYKISENGSRELNEDKFYIEIRGEKRVYLVADGCGGHSGGEIAAGLICDYLPELLFEGDENLDSVKKALEICNLKVLEKQRINREMRSTVVGLFKTERDVFVFNIGDSRLYQVRDGNIMFVTEDHSVPFLLYKAGIIAKDKINTHEDRNKLLEAVGNKEKIKINVYSIDAKGDDVFILATDGFWEHFYDRDFASCTCNNAEKWLQEKIELIKEMNDPEQDNYTVMIIGGINE